MSRDLSEPLLISTLCPQIRVFCRLRPHPTPALICTSDGQGLKAEVDGKEQIFYFDKVFPATSSQQDVFDEVSELIQSALDGFQVQPSSHLTGSRSQPDDFGRKTIVPFEMCRRKIQMDF